MIVEKRLNSNDSDSQIRELWGYLDSMCVLSEPLFLMGEKIMQHHVLQINLG